MPDVKIKAVGAWDTVGSLGIPDYTAGEGRADIFQFADTQLNPKVENGFHAVSMDERRGDFVPTLWDARAGVSEVWFAGAHADVGGGYAERHLSDIALLWMAEKLQGAGLLIRPGFADTVNPDPHGASHAPWDELPWRRLPFVPRALPQGAILHESVEGRRAAGPR